MPNQLNNAENAIPAMEHYTLLLPADEFDKNANFVSVGARAFLLSAELVWRLSEFAFFVRGFGYALFYFHTYKIIECAKLQLAHFYNPSVFLLRKNPPPL